ncbi:MAG: DUF2817 domain-containing protein [Candidatus Dojkabacteria bacterium]|nr:DUF2817 domain-containing protein [Candidatus Dojkabacteria bacterium]
MKSKLSAKNRKKLKWYILTPIIIGSLIVISIISIILFTKLSLKISSSSINTSEEFCLEGNFIFPTLYKFNSDIPAIKEIKDKIVIFNKFTIFAKQICFTPTELLPESNQYPLTITYFDNIDLPIFQKEILLSTEEYPEVSRAIFTEKINKNDVLIYQLDGTNNFLEYQIGTGEIFTNCTKEDDILICDITSLNLNTGEEYELSLISKYDGEILDILDQKIISVLTSVKIVDSSIEEDEVLTNPDLEKIELETNKEITDSYVVSLEDSNSNEVEIEVAIERDSIKISLKEELKQNTEYLLTVSGLTGLDGSEMEKEYILNFSVSDGPKISSSNIQDGFSTSNNIVLYFNQNLDSKQNIKSFLTLDGKTEYSYSIYNNRVTINPSSNLSFCADHTIKIKNGIKSNTGLISSKSYTYSFKTTCKRTYSIGTSVDGRSIYAYYFGTGSKKIIFYAAMHGSESNTKYTLTYWISELEKNSDNIPDDKTVIVVPVLNPDGVANSTRFNSNGVDLNRNFDSSTWTPGTYFLNTFYPTGGGDTPFSEPESRAIRDLIYRESPYLTLSYHSAAGYVVPSNTSIGIELGRVYSSLSGYKYVAPGNDDAFSYDITGAFGEWAQEHGYNSLTIELSSAYYNQFTQNKSAMWEMVKR